MENTEPRWLNSEERAAWTTLMGVVMRLPTALDTQLRRDAGLSNFEYGILAALSEAPGRTMRMSELAMLAEGSLARLSQAVGRLEKPGWITRCTDPADGRYTLATLTDDGWAKVVDTAPGHVANVRTLIFDSLTRAQVRQLHEIGRRITTAIDPDNPCPASRSTR